VALREAYPEMAEMEVSVQMMIGGGAPGIEGALC
jgi:hypothetical protein